MNRQDRQVPAEHRRAIGTRIVERRRTKSWTQRELARRLGIPYMRLSRLENGHVTPSVADLIALARELDASLDEIVWGTDPCKDLESFGTPEDLEIIKRMLRIFVLGLQSVRPEEQP